MNKLFFIFIFLGSVLVSSCHEDNETYDPGYDYYPIRVGNFKIYDVQMITYQPGDSIEENFQIKEVVTDSFVINNELRYRLQRYKKANSSSSWPVDPDSVWSVTVSNQKVVKIENNIRFIKLVFPIKNGQSWNGNSENNYGNETYVLKNVGKPYMVQTTTFSNTATVLQNNDDSFVGRDIRTEVYAQGIGLISKRKDVYFYYQDPVSGKIHPEIRDEGIIYYESLTLYGKQ